MPIEPRDVWRNLPAEVRRAIVDDLAAVLREVNHEIGAHQAEPSRSQSGGVCSSVVAAPGDHNQESLRLQYALRQRAVISVGRRPTSKSSTLISA